MCLDDIQAFYADNKDYIDIHAGNESIFRFLCQDGNLEVAQWLYSLEAPPRDRWGADPENINIHACLEYAFRYACQNGHLDIAKWLYSLDPENTDIHACHEYAFRWACERGHFEVAKWLYSLDPENTDIHYRNDQALLWACERGHLDIAKWLYSLDPENTNIRTNDDLPTAFSYARYYGYKEVAEWLIKMGFVPPTDHSLYGYYKQLQPSREKYNKYIINRITSNDVVKRSVMQYM